MEDFKVILVVPDGDHMGTAALAKLQGLKGLVIMTEEQAKSTIDEIHRMAQEKKTGAELLEQSIRESNKLIKDMKIIKTETGHPFKKFMRKKKY